MKKVISLCLALGLIFAITGNVYAKIPKNTKETKELHLNTFKQKDFSSLNFNDTNEIVIHNYGQAIKTDYFEEGKEEGNRVVAVRYERINNSTVETVYYANVENIDETELNNIISSDKKNFSAAPFVVLNTSRASASPVVKRHQWSFYDNGTKMAVVTTSTEYRRESKNASVNGKKCSVWDVITFTQFERINTTRINEQYTRLSVESFSSEYLLFYGPVGNSSGGEVSVGLDGAGVPSVGYSFSISGFSVKDLSSLSSKYGRWRFVDYLGSEESFTTQPGIRVANTTGSLVVELSHKVEYRDVFLNDKTSSTGVVQDWITDR